MARKKKLIAFLLSIWLAIPLAAYAGGGVSDMPPQQQTAPPVEVHVNIPDKGWLTGEVIAATIAGVLGLAGAIITVRHRRRQN